MIIYVIIVLIITSSISFNDVEKSKDELIIQEDFYQYLDTYKYQIFFLLFFTILGLVSINLIHTTFLSNNITDYAKNEAGFVTNFQNRVWHFIYYIILPLTNLSFSAIIGLLAHYKLPGFLCYQVIFIILIFSVIII